MRDKDLNSISGIYSFKNLINGKQYIGSAHSLFIRAKQHFYYLSVGRHANIHLQRSYDKNGKFAFEFKILAVCSRKDLIFYEQRFIDALNPEYNICKVAGNAAGRKKTPEQKARISELVKNQWANDPERKKRLIASNKSLVLSDESRRKISESSKGRTVKEETRAKIRARSTGRKHTEEARAKISASRIATAARKRKEKKAVAVINELTV